MMSHVKDYLSYLLLRNETTCHSFRVYKDCDNITHAKHGFSVATFAISRFESDSMLHYLFCQRVCELQSVTSAIIEECWYCEICDGKQMFEIISPSGMYNSSWLLKSDPSSYSNYVFECVFIVVPCYVYYFQRGRVYLGYI